ncbi:unnamed protein product [Rangifer tarandus platyrhynchus]|uniref:Uncharacterized protein n=2 Tax=Rangifer tarandus platyrhynchus TaxID=3082113 RepID=A0ACB0EG12_RANTA|nr:unnamed protein product [Rangifer tarandus platyrhynchus]CAI9699166.1 unnamed protein product [Rangifer tarandus platyrhynchus]
MEEKSGLNCSKRLQNESWRSPAGRLRPRVDTQWLQEPCAIQLGEAGKLPERDRSCNHPASRQPEARSLGPRAREGPRGLGTAGESCEARPCQARRARR